ncbi:MAG: 50S ribosomal protein L5 [Bdellovibrionales bacterium]|nr:50S ribosomal protein L5 [Bdellovibrionales bacterium]
MAENRLHKKYKEQVAPGLKSKFNYSTPMKVPRLLKVVLNTGVGETVQNSKAMEYVTYTLEKISGQKPIIRKAKKSIATFKLREGLPIGASVTLRGHKMYSFVDRLFNVALPRVRDFRGTPKKGFDGRGNYTLGIKESTVFPEVDLDSLDKERGLNVTFVTSAETDEEGRALLQELGMPFRK